MRNALKKMDWGPNAWKFLHTVTFAYPPNPSIDQQRAADSFFSSLAPLLPCSECQTHYTSELATHPPDTRSGATLSAWLVDLHNRVNTRLGKPQYSYEQAVQAYTSQCSTCTKERAITEPNTSTSALVILLIIAVVAVFAITYSHRL
jgi:hypothetical protein